jgi:hypothetical protein
MVKRVLGNPAEPTNKETLEKCKNYLIAEIDVLGDR